jgi:integrase
VEGGVYHDLRLGHPIADPQWIERFEMWMRVRGVSGSTRNSYRSALSGMYRLALRPRYRQQTNVTTNPFADIDRDPQRTREVTLTLEQLRAWIAAAPTHVRVALAVGALAPKLRLAQVLALRFDAHLDPALTRITFEQHKTRRHTRQAQVTPVVTDLRALLLAIRHAHPEQPFVVSWRGAPVRSIRRAAKAAAGRAKLTWGLQDGGVTFHALRHAFASACARLGVAELLTSQALGHRDPRTTRKHYTHLGADDERAVLEQLAAQLRVSATEILGVPDSVPTGTPRPTKTHRKTPKTERHQESDEFA